MAPDWRQDEPFDCCLERTPGAMLEETPGETVPFGSMRAGYAAWMVDERGWSKETRVLG